MGRKPCCEKIGLKRGPWTIDEDHKLVNFILNNGIHCWRTVPKLAGLLRCGKSCRLRWINYLRPDLKRGGFTEVEEDQIIQLHSRLGNRWSKIASHFPGRTDNEIKNHWNTRIKKKLRQLGVDPVTHKPINPSNISANDVLIQDKSLNSDQSESSAGNSNQVEEDQIASFETTEDLLKNYEMLWGSLDISPASVEESNSSSSSTVPAMGESGPLIQNDSVLADWFDQIAVDSTLTWDSFDHLLSSDIFYQQSNIQYNKTQFSP